MTMKRFVLRGRILSLFTIVMLLFAASNKAYSFTTDGIYYTITSSSEKTCEVTYYSSSSSSNRDYYAGGVAIPTTVVNGSNTYTVIGIGASAFRYCSDTEWITMPQSITYIGNYAFYNCSGLSEIVVPQNVTSIGDYAFYGCSGLSELSLPSNVESLGTYAFYNCNQITEMTIPGSVTSLGTYAFQKCPLTALRLDDGAETLAISTSVSGMSQTPFYQCPIETLYLGRQISYAGTYSPFREMTTLTSLTLSENITSIGQYEFYGCTALTSIDLPNSLTTIGEYAFQGCTALTEVVVPESVTSISNYAFYNCNLKELYLYGRLDSYYLVFQGLTCDTLYAHKDQIDAIKEYYSGTIVPLEEVYHLSAEDIYPRSIALRVNTRERLLVDSVALGEIEVHVNGTAIAESDGVYVASDLLPSSTYTCTLTFLYGTEEMTNEIEVTTDRFYQEVAVADSTMSSASVAITLTDDPYSSPPDEYGLFDDNGTYYAADAEGIATVAGLKGNTPYTFGAYAKYGAATITNEDCLTVTLEIVKPTMTLSADVLSPFSATLLATIVPGNEDIEGQGFEYGLTEDDTHRTAVSEAMTLTLNSLSSYTTYTYRAYVVTTSDTTYSEWATFTTLYDSDRAYAELCDEIATANSYLERIWQSMISRYSYVYAHYTDDYEALLAELAKLLDALTSSYRNGDLDAALTEETRARIEEITAMMEALHDAAEKEFNAMISLSNELNNERMAMRNELDEVWAQIQRIYSDVAADFEDDYNAIVDALNDVSDAIYASLRAGELDEERADEIRLTLALIREDVYALLAAAADAHNTPNGIDSILSSLDEGAQVYTLTGVRVDTPTRGNVYVVCAADGTRKKVYIR